MPIVSAFFPDECSRLRRSHSVARRWQQMRLAHLLPPPCNRMRASKTRALIRKESGYDRHQTLSNIVFDSHEDGHLVAARRSQACGLRAGSATSLQPNASVEDASTHQERKRTPSASNAILEWCSERCSGGGLISPSHPRAPPWGERFPRYIRYLWCS